MKAFMDERNLDLISLSVFRSLFQYTVLIVFYEKKRGKGVGKRQSEDGNEGGRK